MNLAGRRAIVTGAGRGIGEGCARVMASRGAWVAVNDKPGAGTAQETCDAIVRQGGTALAFEANAFDRTGCEALLRHVLDAWDRVDILVSCPAFSIRKRLVDYEPDEFLATLNGTFLSHFHMAQLVARHMMARGGGGKIVFISSIRSFLPFKSSAPYNAGKAALNQMAFVLANEVASDGINVNVIEPGWTDTPGERQFASDADLAAVAPTLPLRRLAKPDDIGKAVAFLVSDDAEYITGATLRVDGGIWFRNLCRDRT